MHQKFQNITIGKGIVAILIAGFISIILANTVDMSGYGLGGMLNLLIPPFLIAMAVIVFLLTYWIFQKNLIRIIILVALCFYLIYTGIAYHLEKESWPLLI